VQRPVSPPPWWQLLLTGATSRPPTVPTPTPPGTRRKAVPAARAHTNPHAQSYSWTPSDSPPLQIAAREEAKALLVRGLARMETVDGVPDEYIVALACGC
jgi:hypothetical protein